MLCPRTVLALCLGMIVSGWPVDALKLRSLGVGIVGLATALVKMPLFLVFKSASIVRLVFQPWRSYFFFPHLYAGVR